MAVHGRPHNLETPIRAWGAHKPLILDDIRRAKGARLKILLKTFNDAEMIEKWIIHHSNIVGFENLIIADNWSTDENLFKIYEKYNDKCIIFHFGGFHNFLHDRAEFPELYAAINDASDYVLAIDTDEFLISIDQGGWSKGPDILKRLAKKKHSASALLTTYLYNYPYSDRLYSFGQRPGQLLQHTKWGKPLVPTSFHEAGQFIHNAQFPEAIFHQDSFQNLFLLHVTQLSKTQRMAANRHKLIARKIITPEDGFADIAKIEARGLQDSVARRAVKEIQMLSEMPFAPKTIAKDHLRLGDAGQLRFLNGEERARFWESYQSVQSTFFSRAPETPPESQ